MHGTAEKKEVVMTENGSQPPIKQPATAVHRTGVVFLAAACAVGRGCNVVCVLCVVSAVYCSGCLVCARGKKHKTSEIEGPSAYSYFVQTVLTFPSGVSVGLSHTQQQQR